jgi:hypothetical protein
MCDWFGEEDELSFLGYTQVCPNCKTDNYLMDVEMFDDDFYEYIKNHKPQPYINEDDYDNAYDYYKALYPLYFDTKKYNL